MLHPKFLLLLLFTFLNLICSAQVYELSGKVLDVNLQPIAYATIRLKNRETGTSSNAKGQFKILVGNGSYEVVVNMIGYETKQAIIIINKKDEEHNFILEKSKSIIKEINVTNTKKDKSEEIIKNVIAKKDDILDKIKQYNVQLYIKAYQEKFPKTETPDTNFSDLIKRAKDSIAKFSARINMAEVITNLDFTYPNKIKETRTGVKKNGNIDNLFFLRSTDGDFNFYKNLISAPGLGDATFLSPISNSGLIAYKYKMLAITELNGIKQYKIKVTPRKSGNALVEGEVIILDSLWVMKSFSLKFPNHLTPEYSSFLLKQIYEDVGNNIWLPIKQEFIYTAAENKRNSGTTIVTYKNYNLDTIFPKKHFGEELSSTTQEAYERDGKFWDENRTLPLTSKELAYITYKDSVYQFTHSQQYYDSIDAKENKVTALKILWLGQSFYKRKIERKVFLPPLPSVWRPFFIGGVRYGYTFNYSKRFKNYTRLTLRPEATYGVLNKDLYGSFNASYLYNPFTQGKIGFNFGRKFDVLFANDAFINFFSRSNYFQKRAASLNHQVELVNGLYLKNEIEYAYRSSLANYKLVNKEIDTLFGTRGIPIFNGQNKPIDFKSYSAFYNIVTLTYTHKQMYIREPRQKVVLGSKYPTVYATWTKGVNGFLNSTVNFDAIEIGANKTFNLGTIGNSKLKIQYNNFLNKRQLKVVDYKWLRRGDPFVFFNPETNFQALDSSFATFKGNVQAHFYHEFNGALINKIPGANKLKIFESAGAGALHLPERNINYAESFFGIEKQIRLFGQQIKLGGFVVSSTTQTKLNPLQWKIGIKVYDAYNNTWN